MPKDVSVLDKARSLQKLRDSTTFAGERDNAARMLAALLKKNNMTEADLKTGSGSGNSGTGSWDWYNYRPNYERPGRTTGADERAREERARTEREKREREAAAAREFADFMKRWARGSADPYTDTFTGRGTTDPYESARRREEERQRKYDEDIRRAARDEADRAAKEQAERVNRERVKSTFWTLLQSASKMTDEEVTYSFQEFAEWIAYRTLISERDYLVDMYGSMSQYGGLTRAQARGTLNIIRANLWRRRRELGDPMLREKHCAACGQSVVSGDSNRGLCEDCFDAVLELPKGWKKKVNREGRYDPDA